MKIILLILVTIILSSCYKEKIVYVEQESKTLEGTWDIEGIWVNTFHDNLNKTTTQDTISFGRDTFEFFENSITPENSNRYMSLANKDTVFHFSGGMNYPFNRYNAILRVNSYINLLGLKLSSNDIINTQSTFNMGFVIGFRSEQEDISKPIKYYEDETNVSFSLEYDYKIDEYRKNYNFIGKGKRIK